MNWILIGLMALNLLMLVWLLLRPAPSPEAALNKMERELRDELQRSASGTRQELGQGMAQSVGLLQQTLLTQQGDATRTQNEQLDSFRVQLAGFQQSLVDSQRDSMQQQSQQGLALREAQALSLARFTEAQEAALRRLGEGVAEQLRVLTIENAPQIPEYLYCLKERKGARLPAAFLGLAQEMAPV